MRVPRGQTRVWLYSQHRRATGEHLRRRPFPCGRGSVRCCGCKGDSNRAARARKRSAEEEPADNRVSVWIHVGHPDGDMAAQVPNKVLTASKTGNQSSVQQAIVRIKNFDPLCAAAAIGVPIEHVNRELVLAAISEIHINAEYIAR